VTCVKEGMENGVTDRLSSHDEQQILVCMLHKLN
jgi:hypothetical protein